MSFDYLGIIYRISEWYNIKIFKWIYCNFFNAPYLNNGIIIYIKKKINNKKINTCIIIQKINYLSFLYFFLHKILLEFINLIFFGYC